MANKYELTATELANITGRSLPAITKYFKESSTKIGKRVLLSKNHVKEYLEKQGHKFDPIYSVQVNLRGASCKSSTTTIMATRMSAMGYKTVVIDNDPQGSASLALGYLTKDEDEILVDLIDQPKSVINSLKRIEENLYLLPSNLGNTMLDSMLGASPHRQKLAISEIVSQLKKEGFNAILIDCSPSLGSSVISAISSIPQHDGILLVPTISDVFSLKGISMLISEAKKIWQSFGQNEPEIKILFQKFDGREKLSLEALSYLQKHPEFSRYLMPTIIKVCSDIPKSQKFGETIYAMAQRSSAKDDYDNVILEITGLNRLKSSSVFSGAENVI